MIMTSLLRFWANQAGECQHIAAKGSYAGHECSHLTEWRSAAHLFTWLMQNHTQVREKTRTQIQDCGARAPSWRTRRHETAVYWYTRWPDGCASTVFLYLSSHSGLSVSFTDNTAVQLHLMGLNEVEPSSMPARLTAAAPQVPCLFPL